MDPITLGLISMGVGAAIKVGSDLFDSTGSNEASAMHTQADMKLSALEENMRRTEGQQTQVLSSTKARMAGSGFDANSPSFTGYITSMATQFEKQNAYTVKSGMQSINQLNQAADLVDSPAKKILSVGTDLVSSAMGFSNLAKPGQGIGGNLWGG